MLIHVDTDELRSKGQALIRNAEFLREKAIETRHFCSLLGTAWLGSNATEFQYNLRTTANDLIQLADNLEQIGFALIQKSERWLELDSFQQMDIGYRIPAPVYIAIAGAGMISAGMLTSWGYPAWLLKITSFLPEQLRAWLRIPVAPQKISLATQSSTTRFEGVFSETGNGSSGLNNPKLQAAEAPISSQGGGIRYDVPVQAQGSLGKGAACSLTSTSMVLEYFHAKDKNLPTYSPEQLLKMTDKGEFTPGVGMSLDDLTDELNKIGYLNVHSQVNAGKDVLIKQLTDGPVITTVKLNMKTGELTPLGNATHAVVVTGISQSNDQVYINDPWTGKSVEMLYSDFEKTWQAGMRGLYVIRP